MQTTAVKDAVDSKDEPSMEEILASIRKIISEQDAPPAEAQSPVVQEELVVTEEEPFELTQVLEDDGSITDLAILRALPATFEEMLATETADTLSVQSNLEQQEIHASVDVVMETTDATVEENDAFFERGDLSLEADIQEPSTQAETTEQQEQEEFAPIALESVEDAEIDEAAVEAVAADSFVEEENREFNAVTTELVEKEEQEAFLPPHLNIHEQLENIAAEMNKEDEEFTMEQVFEEEPVSSAPAADGLLSTTAAQASLAALANLKRTLAQPTPVKVSTEEGRTVEDLLSDLLKPMLKEWLDTNLPTMIENIVTAEIKKLTSTL
jgi:cell pole-organizing protein PopZ